MLVVLRLHDEEDGIVSIHGRMRAMRPDDTTPPPGWPRASGPCVLLSNADPATLWIFDCAVHPLHVRISCADVMAVWSFGAGVVEGSGEVERRQGGVELLEER